MSIEIPQSDDELSKSVAKHFRQALKNNLIMPFDEYVTRIRAGEELDYSDINSAFVFSEIHGYCYDTDYMIGSPVLQCHVDDHIAHVDITADDIAESVTVHVNMNDDEDDDNLCWCDLEHWPVGSTQPFVDDWDIQQGKQIKSKWWRENYTEA